MGKAGFDVFIQDQRVVAGNKMRGFVLIDATKQISGSAVMVRLSGEEKTTVRYEEGDWSRNKMVGKHLKPAVKGVQSMMKCFEDNNYERTNTKDASVSILSVEVPVGSQSMIANKKIEPGKYKLPFEIDLPPSLPASMHVSQEEGHCEIYYEIEAHLEGSGWFSDYKASRVVYMQAKPIDESNSAVPFEGPPETMPIRLLRCKHVGDMTYACHMQNTVLACGQAAQVSMACQNNSTLGISSVVAELVQVTSWEAGGYESEYEKTIQSETLPNWDALQPITNEKLEERKSVASERDTSTEEKILEDLNGDAHKVTIRVPNTAHPTYEGQLMSIKHILRIRLVSTYYLDFVAPCPKVEIPIRIWASDQNQLMPAFDLPAWANDLANLVVASAVYIPTQAIAYSGVVVLEEETDTPVPEVYGEPSIELFLDAMKKTSNHLGLANQKTNENSWSKVWQNLSPTNYRAILGEVHLDFRKGEVAVVLAKKSSNNFTCAHVASGTKSCPDWMKAGLVDELLKYVTDFNENKNVIISQLSDWEKLVLRESLKDTVVPRATKTSARSEPNTEEEVA